LKWKGKRRRANTGTGLGVFGLLQPFVIAILKSWRIWCLRRGSSAAEPVNYGLTNSDQQARDKDNGRKPKLKPFAINRPSNCSDNHNPNDQKNRKQPVIREQARKSVEKDSLPFPFRHCARPVTNPRLVKPRLLRFAGGRGIWKPP